MRKVSVVIAYFLHKIGVLPVQVVLFRVFIVGGFALFFLFQDDYWYNIGGFFLLALVSILDQVDGDIARNYNQITPLGGFLDAFLDAVFLNSLIFTLTLRFYFTGESDIFVIGGILALFGTIFSAKMTDIFRYVFRIECGTGNSTIDEYHGTHTLDTPSFIIYKLITPRGIPYSLFSNARDYLVFGILFDILPITILLFGIMINLRWILLTIALSAYYVSKEKNGDSRIALFRIMRKLEP